MNSFLSDVSRKFSRKLEDAFFISQDKKLLQQRRLLEMAEKTKESISKISGIKNNTILQKLIDLNIKPEMITSLSLVPIIMVAWADGLVTDEERKTILKVIRSIGIEGEVNSNIVQHWLQHEPSLQLFSAWQQYIKGLCEQLTVNQKNSLKKNIMDHAKAVAKASGFILNKISKAEKEILTQIEDTFAL